MPLVVGCGGFGARRAHRHGWQGGRDTPDEDSPYRARNLLKEEEEAKQATHDMPEIPSFRLHIFHAFYL